MMRVAERFKSANFADVRIDISALYLLADPSTPTKAAAEEAMALAQQGEAISHARAKQIINKHRGVQTLSAYKAAPPLVLRAHGVPT